MNTIKQAVLPHSTPHTLQTAHAPTNAITWF